MSQNHTKAHSWHARRLSRRRFVAGAGASTLGASAFALVGCGDDDDDAGGTATPAGTSAPVATATPTTPASQILRGGQMNVVWETEPQGTIEPHKTAGGFSRPIGAAIFEGFLYKPAGAPAAGLLVSSWETPDPQTFVFNLRDGVKFHDDTTLDAEIAKWNLERTLEKGKINEGGYKGAAAGISAVEAVDKKVLRVKFDRAKVDSLSAFYWLGINSLTGMVSRSAVDALGDGFDRKPVGTGPFKMREWASGKSMTLDKFAGYWQKGEDGQSLPYLDTLRFVDVPELNVAVLSLENGEVDSVMVGPLEGQQLESKSNISLARKLVPDLIMWVNHNKPPFDDVRLRKAVAYAIRRDEIMAAAFFGQAEAFGGGFHPDGDWYDANFKGQTYDPKIARTAMAEAGVPDGFTFDLAVLPRGPRKTAAELMQAQLQEVGIKMQISLMESNDYVSRGLRNGELQAILAGAGTTGLNETPTTIQSHIGSGFAMNPPADKAKIGLDLFARTQTEFDGKARYALFQELGKWFWLDFFGRIDVGREVKVHASRSMFGGFEWFSSSPQGWFNAMYRRKA